MMEHLQAERIESFKAGVVGGIAAGVVFLFSLGLHWAIAQSPVAPPTRFVLLPTTLLTSQGWVSALSIGITGFLFGVAYRYILRQDNNPQLKSGAVLAFGLTRALAQMEMGLALAATPWMVTLLAAESLMIVMIARLGLDWAIAHGWVKPFRGATVSAVAQEDEQAAHVAELD